MSCRVQLSVVSVVISSQAISDGRVSPFGIYKQQFSDRVTSLGWGINLGTFNRNI